MLTKYIYLDGKKSRYIIRSNGDVFNKEKSIVMAGGKDSDDYHIVSLSMNGKKFTKKIHRLVAEAFIPNPNNLPEVNHLDGNKWNNNLSNLEWSNTYDNVHHACKTNLRKSTLKEEDVIKICELLESGKRISGISRLMNLNSSLISRIKTKSIWREITSKYDFSKYSFSRASKGSSNGNSVITEDIANKVCMYLEMKESPTEISVILGIPRNIVYRIKNRETWKHVSSNYKF